MQPIHEQIEHEMESAEEARTRRWRFKQFRALGVDYATSALMLDSPVDLGVARTLVALGCPRETASQILL